MPNDIHEKDPIYQAGQRYQQQRMDNTMQHVQQAGDLERAIQKRVSHFLLFGLPQWLWQRSRIAVFLYIVPFWSYILFVAAVTIGIRTDFPYAIAFYCLGILFFLLMVGSMFYGFRNAFGFSRILAALQLSVATLFAVVGTYRAFTVPARAIPFEPKSLECAIAILAMFVLFVFTVLTDLFRSIINKQSME
jgi:hypothetical protein